MKLSKEDGTIREERYSVDHNGLWKRFWGSKRNGSHIHHIIPLSVGGVTEIGNIIELHPDDHKIIHERRGDTSAANGCFMKIRGFKQDYSYLKGNKHKLGKKESMETRRRKSEAKTGVKRPDQSKFMKENFDYDKYFPQDRLDRILRNKIERRDNLAKEKGFDNFTYFSVFVKCHVQNGGYMTEISREYDIKLDLVREAKNYKI